MQGKAAFAALMFIAATWPCWAGVAIDKPRCQYQVDPLGIDVVKPRLSWILQSPERAEKQTAYRVLVASSPDMLANDQGDLWDSGRVASDQTIHVEYAGKPLASRMQCFWKVRAWDKSGQASAWSKPARWTMGLLSPSDWDAKWIAYFNPADPPPVTPHNGYHCEIAASANVAKWVAVDLGKEQTIDAVRLFPARPFDYPGYARVPVSGSFQGGSRPEGRFFGREGCGRSDGGRRAQSASECSRLSLSAGRRAARSSDGNSPGPSRRERITVLPWPSCKFSPAGRTWRNAPP